MGLPTAEHPIKHTYTPEDQQKLDATLQAIANSGKTVFDATKQNSKMFVIFADGTENNRWDKTLEETIISRLQRSAEKGLRELGAGEARYYAGPGTGVDNASGAMGKYLGADVDDIAERIYEDYASFVIKNPGVEVSIAGMGFSRGGGVLSFASHYIVERGVPDPTANKIITPGPNGEPIVSYDKYLVWPGEANVTKLVMGLLPASTEIRAICRWFRVQIWKFSQYKLPTSIAASSPMTDSMIRSLTSHTPA